MKFHKYKLLKGHKGQLAESITPEYESDFFFIYKITGSLSKFAN